MESTGLNFNRNTNELRDGSRELPFLIIKQRLVVDCVSAQLQWQCAFSGAVLRNGSHTSGVEAAAHENSRRTARQALHNRLLQNAPKLVDVFFFPFQLEWFFDRK